MLLIHSWCVCGLLLVSWFLSCFSVNLNYYYYYYYYYGQHISCYDVCQVSAGAIQQFKAAAYKMIPTGNPPLTTYFEPGPPYRWNLRVRCMHVCMCLRMYVFGALLKCALLYVFVYVLGLFLYPDECSYESRLNNFNVCMHVCMYRRILFSYRGPRASRRIGNMAFFISSLRQQFPAPDYQLRLMNNSDPQVRYVCTYVCMYVCIHMH